MSEKNINIRLENRSDYRNVENLTREAFWNVYRPGCMEHYVLHCFRDDPAFIPELDFVMELDGQLIGQVIYVRSEILTLSQFEWNNKTRILLYGQCDYPYGQPLAKPELTEGNPIRLYSMEEITGILSSVGMSVTESSADFNGKPSSDHDLQLLICAEKK